VPYALGVSGDPTEEEHRGSTGVYVFDTADLAFRAHWAPTSDFMSIGVSRDGSVVYAAGLPGHDADGREVPLQGGSVTVFDAATGAIRAIAGQLETSVELEPALSLVE
jgi:hypothetical protein